MTSWGTMTSVAVAVFSALVAGAAGWGAPNYKVGVSLPYLGWAAGSAQEANAFATSTAVFADLWKVNSLAFLGMPPSRTLAFRPTLYMIPLTVTQGANYWWGRQCSTSNGFSAAAKNWATCSFTEDPKDYWTGQAGTFDAEGNVLTVKASSSSTFNYVCASIGSGGAHVLADTYVLKYTGTATFSFENDAVAVPASSSAGRAMPSAACPVIFKSSASRISE